MKLRFFLKMKLFCHFPCILEGYNHSIITRSKRPHNVHHVLPQQQGRTGCCYSHIKHGRLVCLVSLKERSFHDYNLPHVEIVQMECMISVLPSDIYQELNPCRRQTPPRPPYTQTHVATCPFPSPSLRKKKTEQNTSTVCCIISSCCYRTVAGKAKQTQSQHFQCVSQSCCML